MYRMYGQVNGSPCSEESHSTLGCPSGANLDPCFPPALRPALQCRSVPVTIFRFNSAQRGSNMRFSIMLGDVSATLCCDSRSADPVANGA